jgi:hypothetical protein
MDHLSFYYYLFSCIDLERLMKSGGLKYYSYGQEINIEHLSGCIPFGLGTHASKLQESAVLV